jgi:hypothetical protein
MSFVEGIAGANLDLADPAVMLSVCVTVILLCVLLDSPAILRAVRAFRRKRRLARIAQQSSARSRPGIRL